MAADPNFQLAESYLHGFDVKDGLERDYIRHILMSGCAPAEEIKRFTNHSLLRGLEEWDHILCRARSMKENASFENPLDGQDMLTFLAKIYGYDDGAATENSGDREANSKKEPNTKEEIREPLTIRVKVKKQSPYWSDSHDQPGESTDEQAERLARNREKRKAKKAKRRQNPSSITRELTPVSKESLGSRESPENERRRADSHFLGGQRLFKREPLIDTQESMSEAVQDVLLDDVHQQEISANTGLAKSSKSPPPPSSSSFPGPADVSFLFDTAATRDDDSMEKDGAHPDSPNGQLSTLPVPKQPPKRITRSHYFAAAPPLCPSPSSSSSRSPSKPPPSPRPPRGTVSCIPFPPLDAPRFGLIQEELAHDPFGLLVAVTFLIRTRGAAAIPVFRQLMLRYPSPAELARPENEGDIAAAVRHLGLGAVRAAAIRRYARLWASHPPRAGVRYEVRGYDADLGGGGGWEIGHMTQGRYALDSWRIFCRDALRGRGRAGDWQGGAGREPAFQPEWMRVLPRDKELRACLRWMWMREGWEWDPRTGEREVLREEMRRAVQERRVAYDESGGLRILD